MEIKTDRLGLAAFLKMQGCDLLRIEKSKFFVFVDKNDADIDEWSVRYTNACCSKHDMEVCSLKRLRNGG